MAKGTFKLLIVIGAIALFVWAWTKYKISSYFMDPGNRAQLRAAQTTNKLTDTVSNVANTLIDKGGVVVSNKLSDMLDSILSNGKASDAQASGTVAFSPSGDVMPGYSEST